MFSVSTSPGRVVRKENLVSQTDSGCTCRCSARAGRGRDKPRWSRDPGRDSGAGASAVLTPRSVRFPKAFRVSRSRAHVIQPTKGPASRTPRAAVDSRFPPPHRLSSRSPPWASVRSYRGHAPVIRGGQTAGGGPMASAAPRCWAEIVEKSPSGTTGCLRSGTGCQLGAPDSGGGCGRSSGAMGVDEREVVRPHRRGVPRS